MATHSSVLAWRIPGTAVPGGLPSMGLHRVGHNRSDLAAVSVYQTKILAMSMTGYEILTLKKNSFKGINTSVTAYLPILPENSFVLFLSRN